MSEQALLNRLTELESTQRERETALLARIAELEARTKVRTEADAKAEAEREYFRKVEQAHKEYFGPLISFPVHRDPESRMLPEKYRVTFERRGSVNWLVGTAESFYALSRGEIQVEYGNRG